MPDIRVLNLPLNKAVIKTLPGDEKLSYIEPTTAVRILDLAFGKAGWSFEVIDKWTTEIPGYDIIFNVHGRLKVTIDSTQVTRDYIGSTSMRMSGTGKDANGRYLPDPNNLPGYDEKGEWVKTSAMLPGHFTKKNMENLWKSTVTDCFKKCAAQIGVAQEMYGKTGDERIFDFKLSPKQLATLDTLKKNGLEGKEDTIVRWAGLGWSKVDLHPFNFDEFCEKASEYLSANQE